MSDQERLTPERLTELRRIAEAATPGKRVVFVPEGRRGHEWLILQADGSVSSVITVINKWARNMSTMDYCDADAEFFATFDPTTVLAMLDRIEALEYMLLRLHQDTVVPDTGYCHRCGCQVFHDETCAMAEVEELLGIEAGEGIDDE